MNHTLRILLPALSQPSRQPRCLRAFVTGFTVLIERAVLAPVRAPTTA